MSETNADRALLSREELDALMASMAERGVEDRARLGSRPLFGSAPQRPGRLAPLLRLLDDFAEEQSRVLSTLHQTPIGFALREWEEVSPAEFLAALRESDRVAVCELEPAGLPVYLLLGRPLVFGWLSLAFGARPRMLGDPLPARPYTRIEERFLARAAGEVVRQLERSWRPQHALRLSLQRLDEPERVPGARAGAMLAASFAVTGLGELCRLRVALPIAAFEAEPAAARAPHPARPPRASPLQGPLAEVTVEARVEVGSAELALERIAALEPGAVIPLERADARGLLVSIEGRPKFVAQRGSVGGRLAVQITDRV